MDRNSIDWQGPFTALVTPFDAQGEIDKAGLRRQVEFLISRGAAGLIPNGCTGEFWAQSFEERKRVGKIVAECAARRVPVIPGVGASTTREAIELAAYYREIGCDGVMVMAPYMVHPKGEDIFHHFKTISDSVRMPLMLYSNPQDIGNDINPAMVRRLCDLENVVAIKDSTFDFNIFWKLQCSVADRIRVFIGPSTMFGAAAILMGGDGWVDTYSNLWPDLTIELYQAARAGDVERARRLQKTGAQLREFLLHPEWNMYCAVKAAMNIIGLPGGNPRPPLRPLNEPHLTLLRKGLQRFGVPRFEAGMRSAAE